MNVGKHYLGWLFVTALLSAMLAGTQSASGAPEAKYTVWIAIAGDSTVADYKLTDPHRGWGQLFPEFVTRQVAVQNFAVNGRSTKTFKSEGLWDKTLASHPNYVFIQFGHNDSHSKDHPEATDADTDYSAYLREYVDTARAQGAIPILVTPMHRGQWNADGTHLSQELLPYAAAMRRVASEKKAPLVDLYSLSETAFEKMGKEELETIFAIPSQDHTHFNEKGARILAGLVAEETARVVPALKAFLVLPKAAADATRPTLFIIGDSTVKNDAAELMGWGDEIAPYFDTARIAIKNKAVPGRSTRSFLDGLWAPVVAALKPGDFVLIQFGHNDDSPITQARGTVQGTGNETQEAIDDKSHQKVTVHSYGWYLRQYIHDIKSRGATPIVLSPVPRNWWVDEQHLKNRTALWGGWAKEVAVDQKVPFDDLNGILAKEYEPLGQTKVTADYFTTLDGTHTSLAGAKLAAKAVVEGIQGLTGSPLRDYLVGAGGKPGEPTVIEVDTAGKGDFTTVQAAVDAVPSGNTQPVVIRITPGTYTERVTIPKDKPFLTLRGVNNLHSPQNDRTAATLTFSSAPPMLVAVLTAQADDFRVQNLTIDNASGVTAGQQQAVMSFGDRQVYENVALRGWQDTLWTRADGAREYFHNCEIWGSVDFIYGSSIAVFDHCDIVEQRPTGGYLTAPSTPQTQPFGLVFLNCHARNKTGGTNNTVLGRPWGAYGASAFINCLLEDNIKPAGWREWGGREATCRFSEFGSKTPDGKPIDVSQRLPWSHQLTSDEAAKYALPNIFSGWNPGGAE